MKPYYDDGCVTIYHADCREILTQNTAGIPGDLGAVVSDPPYGMAYQHGARRGGGPNGA